MKIEQEDEQLIYEYGLDICTYYEQLVIDRRTDESRSLYNIFKSKNKNVTENIILRRIISEQDHISVFIFIITKKLYKIYPKEAEFLKLKYYDSFTTKQIKTVMNMKDSSFYRLRRRAYIEIGKIYLDINGETINDIRNHR